jgi:hypothetical protein
MEIAELWTKQLLPIYNHFLIVHLVQPCPKVAFWGLLRPDLRHFEFIFWDDTWHTSSLGQNLDPIF